LKNEIKIIWKISVPVSDHSLAFSAAERSHKDLLVGAFAKLQKATINFIKAVCLSVDLSLKQLRYLKSFRKSGKKICFIKI
jgi:hypothetical protein